MNKLEAARPIVVMDTNVVLDWLVFRNSGCIAVAAAIADGGLRWIATLEMREELVQVLASGRLDAWAPNPTTVWRHWRQHCTEVSTPVSAGPPGQLRCSDPDDQKFIDLAVASHARWLLSRDRAVRRLATRLRGHGVDVLTPDRWAAQLPV